MKSVGTRISSLFLIPLGLTTLACSSDPDASKPEPPLRTSISQLSPQAGTYSATFARQWMTNLAFSVKYDNISPPVASRSFAYTAIAGYEAVVHGMPGYASLAGQINGLTSLPEPDPNLTYDWPTVLTAAMGRVANATYVFPNTVFFEYTTATRVSLGSLERTHIAKRRVSGVDEQVIEDSIEYGHALGDAIADWANADGYAEARYKAFVPVAGDPSNWVMTGFADDQTRRAQEPHFADVRTIALSSSDACRPPPPVAFSTDPESAMYAEANAVYQADLNLTTEQREIALYWADGARTETPPGHWIKIVNGLVRQGSLVDAVTAYLPVTITMFDSAIATWDAKFEYNFLRPETYIHRYIDSEWIPLIKTPPFPTYTSGHSGFSAAAASSLTSVLGAVPFTDKTKVRAGFPAKTYANFMEAAEEAALSRLYGGIHYPMDNSVGIEVGKCVANAFATRVVLQP